MLSRLTPGINQGSDNSWEVNGGGRNGKEMRGTEVTTWNWKEAAFHIVLSPTIVHCVICVYSCDTTEESCRRRPSYFTLLLTQQSQQGSRLEIQEDNRCRRRIRVEQKVPGERVQDTVYNRDDIRRPVQPCDTPRTVEWHRLLRLHRTRRFWQATSTAAWRSTTNTNTNQWVLKFSIVKLNTSERPSVKSSKQIFRLYSRVYTEFREAIQTFTCRTAISYSLSIDIDFVVMRHIVFKLVDSRIG